MRLLPLILLLLLTAPLAAQTVVTGRVLDADTGQGIPFANIFVRGTTIGNSSDVDGNYELVLNQPTDSLYASALGYLEISRILPTGSAITLDFELSEAGLELSEVVVYAGENPANAIVRGIIENKDKFRPEANGALSYESYNKMEVDYAGINPNVAKSKFMKPFSFVFENIDSVSEEKPFLPFFINERIEDVYYVAGKKDPKTDLRAQRASGIDNPTILDMVQQVYQPYSIYDNWLYVLEKPLVSPFANSGLGYYEYYLLDSTDIAGRKSYQLKFKGKRRMEPTFYGEFWVDSTSYAVQRISMRLNPDANVNLLSRVVLYDESAYQQGSWLPVNRRMLVDFSLKENQPGFIVRRTESMKDFSVGNSDIYVAYDRKRPSYALDRMVTADSFWVAARHDTLTARESRVYWMVDSIQKVPAFERISQWTEFLATGYWGLGKVEVGAWGNLYSRNPVEGNRIRLGMRTTTDWNDRLRLGGRLAYGFGDKRIKYGADFKWVTKRQPRRVLGGGYSQDVSLTSSSSEEPEEADLFTGIFRRNVPQKLVFMDEAKLFYDYYWENGFSNRFTGMHRRIDPFGEGGFKFAYLPDPENPTRVDSIVNTTEFSVKTRFAFEEHHIDGPFSRATIVGDKPITELTYTLGVQGLLGGNYSYHRIHLSYRHFLKLNPLGWFSYRVEAGKQWGEVPFLLTNIFAGNESYAMSRSVFNTMNRYEFAADTYIQGMVEHHFEGFFLNKIPLLRRLEWREVLTAKAAWGKLSSASLATNAPNLFDPNRPDGEYIGVRAPDGVPYIELGVGIENIFKFFRVDVLFRPTYLDNPRASRVNVVGGIYFNL